MNMLAPRDSRSPSALESSTLLRRAIAAGLRQIMHPTRPLALSKLERQVLGAFTAGHLGEPRSTALFDEWLSETALELAIRVADAAEQAARPDPYGKLPGFLPLQHQDAWYPDAALRAQIGQRLSAALAYVHQVLANPEQSQGVDQLLAANWSPEAVAEIDALIGFIQQMALAHVASRTFSRSLPDQPGMHP